MAHRSELERWLAGQRFAILGISVASADITRRIFRALLARDRQVYPVRAGVTDIEGHRAYARVQDIPVRIDGALVVASPTIARRHVLDCVEAGVPRVWVDPGPDRALDADTIAYAREHGTRVFAFPATELLPPRVRARETVGWLAARLGLDNVA